MKKLLFWGGVAAAVYYVFIKPKTPTPPTNTQPFIIPQGEFTGKYDSQGNPIYTLAGMSGVGEG